MGVRTTGDAPERLIAKSRMTFLSALTSRNFAKTGLLALCWLALVRASHIVQSGIWPDPVSMVASDLAGAVVLAVLLSITAGASRILLVTLLGCAAFVAGMHLTVHGTLFQLSLAGKGLDPTFIAGSLVNRQSLLLPIYLVLAWLLHWLHRRIVVEPVAGSGRLITTAILVVTAYGVSVQSLTTPANNMVASFFAQIPGTLVSPFTSAVRAGSDGQEAPQKIDDNPPFFLQKVATPEAASQPNVLLIMIEGLSAGYFPGVSSYHNLTPYVELADLENNLNRHGFRIYRNPLSMDRQTDRGTFSILCGEYPDLLRQSRKLLQVAKKQAQVDCMPEKLLKLGYTTAYWQAAPLDYMQKGDFMPMAGFSDVTGAGVFTSEGEEIEGWGPPDPVYFEHVEERLGKLDTESGPWMVTLLNVGTHHPFKTEDEPSESNSLETGDLEELTPTNPQEDRRKAMKTMEKSLNRLLDSLAAKGILNETLVIITSDESGGFVRQDANSMPLDNNLGVLALKPPEGDTLERYAPENRIVAQIDIPLTILDVTGLGTQAGDMIGRSLLVTTPKTERGLLLADTYTGLKYFLRESGELLSCSELMSNCITWSFSPERLFGTLSQREDTEPFLTFEERTALLRKASQMKPTKEP